MNFVVIGRDLPGGEARLRVRPDHLEFVAERQAGIVFAGPLIENGSMVGSLFLFDLPDRAALDRYMAEDPYFTTPIFASVEVFETRRMVPEAKPGLLRAEAAKARQPRG